MSDGTFDNQANDNPTNFGANLTRTISWVANDGAANSNTGTTTINITAVNDAPVIGGAGNTIGYTEQNAAVTVPWSIPPCPSKVALRLRIGSTPSLKLAAGGSPARASQLRSNAVLKSVALREA